MARTRSTVTTELAAAIAAEYRPGDRLPPEPALAAAYGVSRATLREALESLSATGLVQRVHGVGTFVAEVTHKVESALDVDLGVTEAVRAANQRVGVQVLRVEERPAPQDMAERLELGPASRVLWIERAILVNDVPAVAAIDAIPVGVAARAARRVSRVLRVEEGEPLLRIAQVERADDDTAVLYSEEQYVPNLFELTIRRRRRGGALA